MEVFQHVRFARPDILFYDAHRIDLYQFICALYLIEEDRRKKRTLKPGSRPKFKVCLPTKGPFFRLRAVQGLAGVKKSKSSFRINWRRECQSTPIER
jgi:hypothetical protein